MNASNAAATTTGGGVVNSNGWGIGADYTWKKLLVTANYQSFINRTTNGAFTIAQNSNDNQFYGAATYGVTTLKYSYAFSNLFGANNSKGSTYWDLSATFDLGNGFSLVPHAGRQTVKNNPTSYTDIALTLNKDLGDGLSASISAISTNAKGKGDFASYLTGYDVPKNTTVVGLKYSF